MDKDKGLSKELSDALTKAVRDFGEGVLQERRLIGILKDFQAFGHCQPAELIIRVMIESNSMRRFWDIRNRNGKDLEVFLLREISTHSLEHINAANFGHLDIVVQSLSSLSSFTPQPGCLEIISHLYVH